jgi:hypothetical protein
MSKWVRKLARGALYFRQSMIEPLEPIAKCLNWQDPGRKALMRGFTRLIASGERLIQFGLRAEPVAYAICSRWKEVALFRKYFFRSRGTSRDQASPIGEMHQDSMRLRQKHCLQ